MAVSGATIASVLEMGSLPRQAHLMQLNSRTDPFFRPDPEQQSVLRLGLTNLDPREWIVCDSDFELFQQHKLALYRQHPGLVYQALPESQAAQQELADSLLLHLRRDHDRQFTLESNHLLHHASGLQWPLDRCDLWHSSLWVQEDLCLLQEYGGEYHLTAASVCSPSNWKLEEKIGRGLDVIHGPVPGYQEVLAARVNRLLAGLKANKPLLRYNWSIQRGNELFWRDELQQTETGADKYWRVERQTLVRLPRTGAVVFGIRLFLHSFRRMNELMDFDGTVRQLIAGLPNAEREYKNLK